MHKGNTFGRLIKYGQCWELKFEIFIGEYFQLQRAYKGFIRLEELSYIKLIYMTVNQNILPQ